MREELSPVFRAIQVAILCSVTFGFALIGAAAPNSDPLATSDLCLRAAKSASRTHQVPLDVLVAISIVETGRTIQGQRRPWPWAVNVEGKGQWFATRRDAEEFVSNVHSSGRDSFDSGCFQINYRWHRAAFQTPISMFDPQTSANYAAKFLKELHNETGDWAHAAGAYHSRNPKFSFPYQRRFEAALAANQVIAPATAPRLDVITQSRDFPLLTTASDARLPGSLFAAAQNAGNTLINLAAPRAGLLDD